MTPIETIMRTAPVIPVLVIEDVATAKPIAEALVAGGLRVLEVTLRTEAALNAIAEMKQVEGAIVGAGTVLDARALERSIAAGAEFIVSPGLTDNLADAAHREQIPLLPPSASAGLRKAPSIVPFWRGLSFGRHNFSLTIKALASCRSDTTTLPG